MIDTSLVDPYEFRKTVVPPPVPAPTASARLDTPLVEDAIADLSGYARYLCIIR